MADKQELATAQSGTLEPMPEYLKKGSRRGMEGTQQSDVLIPRLALAQALSPQLTDGDPNRIEGLKVGDLFNSVTRQNYGKQVFVQIIRRMPLRAIEFNRVEDGGGVKDPNVPLDDERLRWHGEEKPVATLFRDFFAVILPQRELIALSFKGSGLTAAKALLGLAMVRGGDIWAGRYSISSAPKLTPKPHQIYKIDNAGWASEGDASAGEAAYEAIKDIDASAIERKAEPEADDTSFDTDAMEREAEAAQAAASSRTDM